ncbi:HAD family phosphatase [Candidatus Woesearchaeota archaeon]|nr:MAG: HAD family phosphatase [Candidatus Woesearchaeota archaeon]
MQKKDETVLKSETKFLNQGLILNDMGIAVIFDMDGVLVNTIPFHKQAWKAFCKKYNFEYSEEELNRILPGKTTAHLLRLLFGKDLSEEEIKRLAQEKGEFYRGFSYKNLELIKGAVPFLEELTKNKIPIAIGTSGSPNNVSFIMNNTPLKNYFEVIVDSSQVTKSKPDPEVFLTAAKKIGAEPKDCIVFEDSLAGIEAAKRAGMKAIGLTTTHPREELNEADLVIDDFSEISLDLIKRFLKQN